ASCLCYGAAASAEPVRFDIPAQDLATALIAFSDQSHLRITVAPGVTEGLRTSALMGSFEPAEALRRLIGAGLSFEFVDPQDVVVGPRKRAAIEAPAPADGGDLEEIVVTAQKYK